MERGIVQLHLTRRCNLRCAHCYSESGPTVQGELDLSILGAFLNRARQAGYSHLSLSGGEPLLYSGLVPLLQQAKRAGWLTSAVTNGTLLQRRSLAPALELLDLVGVSVDGAPVRHDRLRGAESFERTRQGLAALRARRARFVLTHTLTRESVDDLPWLVDFAINEGAAGLRLHPLEDVGFGRSLATQRPTPRLCAEVMLWLLGGGSRGPATGLPVEADLMNRERLRRAPETVWAALAAPARCHADAADPLVVEADGSVVPFTYGIDRRFRLGGYEEPGLFGGEPRDWSRRLAPLVDAAIESALELEWPFFNWYEHLMQAARKAAEVG